MEKKETRMPLSANGEFKIELKQGIQRKFLLIFVFLAIIITANIAYELYALLRISELSRVITEDEIPRSQARQEATLALLNGHFAFSEAMSINDVSKIEKIRKLESELQSSIIVFDSYLAAMTWGSESEAFRRSDGGLNFQEWKRLGLQDKLIIRAPQDKQMQLAGAADIYFGAFSTTALDALASHKKFLRLESESRFDRAASSKDSADKQMVKVFRFLSLTRDALSEISNNSRILTATDVRMIEDTQRTVFFNTLLFMSIGFAFSVAAGILYIRKNIIRPLGELTVAAARIGSGDLAYRAHIESRDEMGSLARVFNRMADSLSHYSVELEREVESRTKELQELLDESYTSAKLLIRKDRELTVTNLELQGLSRDLDEVGKMLVRRDMELSRINERLMDVDEIKSKFVSIAAHQLRTPLTGIKWLIAGLMEGDAGELNKEQEKMAKDISYSVNRLISLVNDLLDVSRLEEGRDVFVMKKGDIASIVKETFNHFKNIADEKGMRYNLHVPDRDLVQFAFDKEKIIVALSNLIDNAIKYTLPGGRILISLAFSDKDAEIVVSDTGIGIPKDQYAHVFNKFFRAHNATLLETSGSGLGLYMSKFIINKHAGTIEFESEEEKGTTFTIRLPLQ